MEMAQQREVTALFETKHERSWEDIDELSQHIRGQGQINDQRIGAMTQENVAADSARLWLEHGSSTARATVLREQEEVASWRSRTPSLNFEHVMSLMRNRLNEDSAEFARPTLILRQCEDRGARNRKRQYFRTRSGHIVCGTRTMSKRL